MNAPRAGQVLGLLVRPGESVATTDVAELTLHEQQGAVGDHGQSARRQVTILGIEGWTAATRELGRDVPWQARRANVLVSGLDLRATIGRRVQLGPCLVEIQGETVPCKVMDEAAAGLRQALVADWRAGVYGTVVRGGVIRTGDPAQLE